MLEHPNVVVICCDTFRADIVGPGQRLSFVETPNLDQLMSESVVFDSAFGEAQPTLPMRLAFFTGNRTFPFRRPVPHRGLVSFSPGWRPLSHDETTLSEKFFEAGYVTGFSTDVFHMFKPCGNYHRGFMVWDFIRGQEADPIRRGDLNNIDLSPHVPDDLDPVGLHVTLHTYLVNVRDRLSEDDYFTPRVFNSAARFLDDNYRHGPFFLWVDSFAPHEFWDPPMQFADRYFQDPAAKDFICPQFANFGDRATITDADIERTKALYYGYVTFVDKWIGRLLDKLDELRLWDDTIVVFTSDHGTEVWDNGRFGKNQHGPREYNARIPLMVRMPGAELAGTHVQPYVFSHDLHATLLALAGIDHPEEIEGRSFWPLVTGEADDLHGERIITSWAAHACVRDREWAMIVDTLAPEPRPELFHSAVDPGESENVAGDNPDVVQERMSALEDFLGQPLPATYAEQPDARSDFSLRRHREIRRERGMPL
ncbi:MAG: sulfatase [Armatimonadetes bacterium]|nr:sulfatase [Armatimonadota bacterium]